MTITEAIKSRLKFFVYYILVPFVLLLLAFLGGIKFLSDNDISLLSLNTIGDARIITDIFSGELLAGGVARGEVRSKYNNFGTLSVRFFNQNRDSHDVLVFRIKEEGSSDWYYEAKYNTDQFQPHKLFPFGFPKISDSAGKKYVFELESLEGDKGNSIFIDNTKPTVIAKSTFLRSEIFQDRDFATRFILAKFSNVFENAEIRSNIFIFFIPFLTYLIYIFTKNKGYQIFSSIIIILCIYDIFCIIGTISLVTTTVAIFWLLDCYRYRISSKVSALFSAVFLGITLLLSITNNEICANKSAVWIYVFLCLFVVIHCWEILTKQKVSNDPKRFIGQFSIGSNPKSFFVLRRIAEVGIFIYLAFLLYSTSKTIANAFYLYTSYFPEDHIKPILLVVILPLTVFYFVTFLFCKCCWVKISKKLLIFLVCLLLNLITSIYINKVTLFRLEPKILVINPNGSSEAWVDVTITGLKFSNKPFVGKVKIDGVEQRIIDWSNEKIIFRTNPQITKSGDLKVIVEDGKQSNSVPFYYNFK